MLQFFKRSVRQNAKKILAQSYYDSEKIELLSKHMDFDYYRSIAQLQEQSKKKLVMHYLTTGAADGLDPAPWFSSDRYMRTNSDVHENGINPFYHYLKWGWAEGRSPSDAAPEGVISYDFLEQIIAAHLDAEFYLDQVNPDRSKVLNAVKHFCLFGWQHHCDPSPDFSTSYYLENNPDIAARGINPYFHYLTEGKHEGRPCARSARAQAIPAQPAALEAGQPRMAVVSMVKNEGDIIQFFASHLMKLFDDIVFIDHQSQDKTKDVLETLAAAHSNVHLYRLEEPGYIQDVVSNHIIRDCDVLRNADWVMFLDADEFLPFPNQQEFREFLAAQSAYPIISFRWKNLIPAQYWDYAVSGFEGCEFYVPEQLSPYTKVAFQPGKMAGEDYWVNQGNHSISRAKGMEPISARDTGIALFHLPIRSANQLAIKLNQGVLSYLRRRAGGGENRLEGQHWFDILDKLGKEGKISSDLLNGVVRDYGQLEDRVSPVDHASLESAGYTRRQVAISIQGEIAQLPQDAEGNVAELMFQLGGAFAASTQNETDQTVTGLVTNADNRIVATSSAGVQIYPALPDLTEPEKMQLAGRFASPAKAIFTLQAGSYLEIKNLPPTAWVGHLPFMFALASVLQPRRFVELGSHHGASFLAYCQASQRAMSGTQAIAVDCWEGDVHAGFYDNKVFDDFKFMLRPYEQFARYIRDYFDNAVHQFEDGSIDMLHIDGLHTHAAVKNDFDTWLPKMSSDGLILFHDTNVHERDFGVWQLWDELTAIYPGAQFRHSHGLGVLYVGSETNSGARAMVEAMRDQDVMRALQSHFESVSQLSASLATLTFEKTHQEEQLQNTAAKEEVFTKLRQRNDNLEAENTTLRGALRDARSPRTS